MLNDKNARPEPSPSVRAVRWPIAVVTLLVGTVAFGLLMAQFSEAKNPASEMSLANLDQRAKMLEPITNWIEREHYCVGLAYTARLLDARLDPGARVFVSGILGPTNLGKAGYYYFLKNYLFPRDVEISLDGKSVSKDDGFHGVPCDSPGILQSNGFDLLIDFNNNGQLIPLTRKGVPHAQ